MAETFPHVLVVNPNANERTTEAMSAFAAAELAGSGVAVRGVTAADGPLVITGPEDLAASVPHVLQSVRRAVTADTVGVIVAAIGDPGVADLRAEFGMPVVGLGEASIRLAAAGGRRFGMVTTTARLAPGLRELVARHGREGTFTGLRFTPADAFTLGADPERADRELSVAVDLCETRDGAETVIVGGGPLSASARRLSGERPVGRIVEPVPSAVAVLLGALTRSDASALV